MLIFRWLATIQVHFTWPIWHFAKTKRWQFRCRRIKRTNYVLRSSKRNRTSGETSVCFRLRVQVQQCIKTMIWRCFLNWEWDKSCTKRPIVCLVDLLRTLKSTVAEAIRVQKTCPKWCLTQNGTHWSKVKLCNQSLLRWEISQYRSYQMVEAHSIPHRPIEVKVKASKAWSTISTKTVNQRKVKVRLPKVVFRWTKRVKRLKTPNKLFSWKSKRLPLPWLKTFETSTAWKKKAKKSIRVSLTLISQN